eukprot:CAMPEP_0194524050 /NCGR_PEP_ID=MMETSP0253-20130528/59096_1 /TAXON_ID=2966 /ORGANISM="Noctiluca scintillans" /LENGTH=461 /DNA_ID=CAMNT_0039368641 /DNA_START=14 /DNA_END=1399 /DNA_ORIENTATION=+
MPVDDFHASFALQTQHRIQASSPIPSPSPALQSPLRSEMFAPLLESEQEPDTWRKTTLWQTTVNATLLLCGAGVLSIPYAIGQGGVCIGFILILLAGVCCWTSILIGNLMRDMPPYADKYSEPQESMDWPFLGFVACGKVGRSCCSFIFMCELWFLMLSYLVTNGINLNVVFPSVFSRARGIVFSGVLSLILLFPSPKMLSYASITGIISAVVAVASLAWSAAAMPAWEVEESSIVWVQTSKVAEAVGILQFCFVAHSAFPTVYRNMEDTKKYSKAMSWSFAFSGLFYFLVGFGAYFVYGSSARPSFMMNLGRDVHLQPLLGLGFLYTVASFCFAVNLQFSFPLFAAGLVATSEALLGISGRVILGVCWKIVLMIVTTFLAYVMRNCMQSVVSLTGTFCATFTCLLLPFFFSLRICSMSRCSQVAAAVGIVYGLWILTYGTYTNVVNIVNTIVSAQYQTGE